MYDKNFARELAIRQYLSKALENKEFSLVFQPIIQHSQNGQSMYAAEVLLRWKQAAIKDVGPDEFIPILEDTGKIHSVGFWIVETVATYIRSWKLITPLKIHVNISPTQLSNQNFAVTIQSIIQKQQISPRNFVFEITEHNLLVVNPVVLDNIHKLIQIGILFAIDDFGTGYGNYQTLSQVPFSILKIDRNFVQNARNTKKDNYLLENIIQLGSMLDLSLIAEGVETKSMLNHVISKGCSLIQGYYYSKPLKPRDFLSYIQETSFKNKISL